MSGLLFTPALVRSSTLMRSPFPEAWGAAFFDDDGQLKFTKVNANIAKIFEDGHKEYPEYCKPLPTWEKVVASGLPIGYRTSWDTLWNYEQRVGNLYMVNK